MASLIVSQNITAIDNDDSGILAEAEAIFADPDAVLAKFGNTDFVEKEAEALAELV